jgi:hypothetical protein
MKLGRNLEEKKRPCKKKAKRNPQSQDLLSVHDLRPPMG